MPEARVDPYMRQHYRRRGRDLLPKREYASKEAALAVHAPDQHAYKCGVCMKWHLGHPRE